MNLQLNFAKEKSYDITMPMNTKSVMALASAGVLVTICLSSPSLVKRATTQPPISSEVAIPAVKVEIRVYENGQKKQVLSNIFPAVPRVNDWIFVDGGVHAVQVVKVGLRGDGSAIVNASGPNSVF